MFVSLIPNRWRKERGKKFYFEQALRLIVGVLVTVFYFYFGLVDVSFSAIFLYYGLIVGILLVVDALSSQSGGKSGSAIGSLFIIAWFVMLFLYPFTLADDKYDVASKKVEVVEQPAKDMNEKHIPVVPKEYARYKSEKLIGKLDNASYYTLGETHIQNINGDLTWVSSIEYDGFFKWWKAKQAPGYIMMSAQDQWSEAQMVKYDMKYTPYAYFGDNLNRLVRDRYPGMIIMDASLEPDKNGKPYYAVSYGHYTNYRNIRVVDGVVMVDPKTGDMKKYDKQTTPQFVEQVVPEDVAEERSEWYGKYQHGLLNAWFGKKDVKQLTDWEGYDAVTGVFDEGKRFNWFTDFTRPDKNSGSMVGYAMMNGRTGKITYYNGANGGVSGKSAIDVAEKAFREKKYHGGAPSLFYLYGKFTWVVPLMDANDVYRQLVLVNAGNEQITGFAENKQTAFNHYKTSIVQSADGDQAVPTDTSILSEEKGVISHVYKSETEGKSTVKFMLQDKEHIYSITSKKQPLAIFLKSGMHVTIHFVESNEMETPVLKMKVREIDVTISDEEKGEKD